MPAGRNRMARSRRMVVEPGRALVPASTGERREEPVSVYLSEMESAAPFP